MPRMDIARKFLQMGRTRSLRYALRRGGRKYEHSENDQAERVEIPRSGEVYDEGKLAGAQVFESYRKRCWEDKVYVREWEDWKAGRRPASAARREEKGDEDDKDVWIALKPRKRRKT